MPAGPMPAGPGISPGAPKPKSSDGCTAWWPRLSPPAFRGISCCLLSDISESPSAVRASSAACRSRACGRMRREQRGKASVRNMTDPPSGGDKYTPFSRASGCFEPSLHPGTWCKMAWVVVCLWVMGDQVTIGPSNGCADLPFLRIDGSSLPRKHELHGKIRVR